MATTISEGYRELNRKLHEADPGYGANGHRFAGTVMAVARMYDTRDILDYGAGKGTLGANLRANGFDVQDFDPAIMGKDAPPVPADIVYCGDVAEHVEPEYIEAFLDDLARLTRECLVLVVATRPAKKTLADGRNAHLTQKPLDWWLPKLAARFQYVEIGASRHEFTFVGVPHDHH